MASSSSLFPRSTVLHIIIIIIIIVILQISVTIRADEQLMTKECHNAENPTLCMQCLKSDTSSPQADSVGLARVILKCLGSHIDALLHVITTLHTSSSSQQYHVQDTLKKCGSAYAGTKKSLARANVMLVSGDYEKGARDVSITTSYILSCWEGVKAFNSSVTVPLTFRYHMRVYLALTQAELRIVDRF